MKPGLRVTSFIAGFAIALVATSWWIVERLDAAEIELEPLTRHGVADYYHGRVEAWRERKHRPGEYNIAFLGDSMVVSYPMALQIPAMLQGQLRRMGGEFRNVTVDNAGLAGTGVYDYYFMADVVGRIDPELVIIAFNLTSTSRNFQAAFSRPELAAWLPANDAYQALLLPVSWIGLTADRLFFSMAVVETGGFDLWVDLNEEQLRVEKARERIEAAWAMTGPHGMSPEEHFRKRRGNRLLARNNAEGGTRHTAAATRDQYGSALGGLDPDHPVLEMLAAAVRAHVERGADVLVYLNPINVEHIESLGLMNQAGLEASIAGVSKATTGAGGHFLDLHGLLPDAGFRDRSGHFAYEAEINGPKIVASNLARAVAGLIRNREARE